MLLSPEKEKTALVLVLLVVTDVWPLSFTTELLLLQEQRETSIPPHGCLFLRESDISFLGLFASPEGYLAASVSKKGRSFPKQVWIISYYLFINIFFAHHSVNFVRVLLTVTHIQDVALPKSPQVAKN